MDDIAALTTQALKEIAQAENTRAVEALRVQYFGKKGAFTEAQKALGSLPAAEKPAYGARLHEARKNIEAAMADRAAQLETAELAARLFDERVDVTLPGRSGYQGGLHPVTEVSRQIFKIFESMGFAVIEGPELEEEYYNFDALNIPPYHPAREEQDSFYVGSDRVLRTQTSAMQIRVMQKFKPPVAAISPGRCFRRDAVDATHLHTFHQVEGFLVDKGVTMADLKGVLTSFAQRLFGSDTKIRFRPDFFPFVEPGAEAAITCFACHGKGCRTCRQSGWIELGGAGMIHPHVFKSIGYDYETYSGFAFGMGIERMVMKKYTVPDIRMFYENDMRFVGQFR
jgi:phenylalanyl-tRNA synthetase alpha chain